MSWSRAEVLALATKAARGAGAPPAQAAMFGEAAALHLGRGRPAQCLAAALAGLPRGPIMALPVHLQRALTALQGGAGTVRFPDGGTPDLARSYLDSQPRSLRVTEADGDGFRVALEPETARERPLLARISGCDALIAQMIDLAARTLVPDSAASRAAGAGASLSDND